MDNPERLGRAARNTGGFSIGPPLFAPEGRIDAQVALGGFVLVRIPDRSARPLRAELDAPPAADAPGLIDDPDIAVFAVNVSGAGRTVLDAEGRYALTAGCHNDVERVPGKRWSIPDNLNSGQGGVRLPLVAHRTGEHAALTTPAQPAVIDQIPGRGCVGLSCGLVERPGNGCRHCQGAGRDRHAAAEQKIPSLNRSPFAIGFVRFSHRPIPQTRF